MHARVLRTFAMALTAIVSATVSRAQSLDTIYTAGNGLGTGVTVFYNLTVNSSLLITSFDVNLSSAAGTAFTLNVYRTAAGGTYAGNQTNAGAWTPVATGSGLAAGANLHSPCDTADFVLSAGTYGIAINYTMSTGNASYTNGNGAVGVPGSGTNQTYSNADMTLAAGSASVGLFSGTVNDPRVWNGTIFYSPANPNAIGACCASDGACQFITVAACQATSGSFRGEGVTCAAVNCPQPTSCCNIVSGACTVVLGACPASATTGTGATCAPTACPLGACCSADGTACSSMSRAACVAANGIPRGNGTTCVAIACGAGFAEVEPNETKALADANDLFLFTTPGNYIRGNTTGAVTTAGATSLDQFHVRLPPATLGIYRNRLTIDSYVAVGHTGSIRGLNQTAAAAGVWPACGAVGTPGATDSVVQTSATTTTPPRFNQWYSFGKLEELFFRVTGVAATTGDYVALWSTDPITPVSIGSFSPGSITITTDRQGHTTNTDLWVYDAMLNPIDGFGNDNSSTNGGASANTTTTSWLTRTYAGGTYYLALSNSNLATNKGSPCDDNLRTGLLMDFPNIAVNSSTTANVNVAFAVTDATGTTQFPATRADAFDVLWFRFTVTDTPGACCAPTGVCSVIAPSTCVSPSLFQGPSSACTGANGSCPTAVTACCNNATGACAFTNGATCSAGSTARGSACSPTPCAPVGICCSSLGACAQIFGGACPSGSTAGAGNTCSGNPCMAPPNICQPFDSTPTGTLPAGWTSTTVAGTDSTGGACQPSGWAVISDQSHTSPNAVFANDPDRTFSQELTMPSITAAGPVTLDLWARWSTEGTTAFDGWTVEVSINGGPFANIQPTPADPNPWLTSGYNGTISTTFNSQISGQRAFFGVSGGGATPAWVEQTAVIPAASGNTVQLKFRMVSDSSIGCASYPGVWLDDICIYNILVPASGVCCRGATCSTTVAQPSCTGSGLAGALFASGAACNSGPLSNTPCCYANYNKQGGITVQDIFDFLGDWFASNPFANTGGTGAPATLSVQNIFDFLSDWFAGGCS